MDDLTAIREFRAERDTEPTEARERVWLALDAHIDAAVAEAEAPSGFFRRRRRVLAFAGAVAMAAIVAGALLLDSGPTAERASAAEILHEAADAAASSDATATLIPGPGEYYFRSQRQLSTVGWLSPVPGPNADVPAERIGGTMEAPGAFNALVPTTGEEWVGPDGAGRRREELGQIKFWDQAEEDRWTAAGSPPPPPFNAEYRRLYPRAFERAQEANSHAIDYKQNGFGDSFHFGDTSKLPTDPKALREQVEANAIEISGFNLRYPEAKHLNSRQTQEELINLLFEGMPSPQLQAAIFDALAEVPGVKLFPATDSLGRQGEALRFGVEDGVRAEFLFDPETSKPLAGRGVLLDPADSRAYGEIPAGTTVSELDYIETGVVGSTGERPEANR